MGLKMKPEEWRQGCAVDQFIALRGRLEGDGLSFEAGHITKSVFLSRFFAVMAEFDKLEPYLRGEKLW